jgi:predicted amidohydrolase YtcJ
MFGEPITRELLDRILPDRPLALFASDHHTMWANTAALRAAGLLHGRTTPPGSEVVMGADGLAAGELREFESFAPVFALAPTGGREMLGLLGREPETPPAAAQRAVDRDTLRRGLGHAASLGITSIHNMDGNAYQLELLGEIDAAEGLPLRCRFPFRVLPGMELRRFAEAAELRERWNSDRLRVDFVKLFMDGVIESATAFMLADYSDRPGFRGSAFFETDEFDAVCIEAERLGFQLAVHAIGDAAVRRTLDGYQAARRRHGIRDTRHRIEHIEALDPADLPRFAELGVIASMQPTHAPGGAYPIEPIASMLGRRRLMTAYAWQTLRNAGARMAFSSDWPIAPLDPLTGIRTAMTRPPLFEGAPDERQSLADALAGFTADGAYAEFAEDRKGVLRPEALADIVVLSGDVEAAAPSEIDGLDVVATICGGRLIYRRDSVS